MKTTMEKTENQNEDYNKICVCVNGNTYDILTILKNGTPYIINLNELNILKVTNNDLQPMPNRKGIINLKELSKINYSIEKKCLIYQKNEPCQEMEFLILKQHNEEIKSHLSYLLIMDIIGKSNIKKSRWKFIIRKNKTPTLMSVQFQENNKTTMLTAKQLLNSKIYKI